MSVKRHLKDTPQGVSNEAVDFVRDTCESMLGIVIPASIPLEDWTKIVCREFRTIVNNVMAEQDLSVSTTWPDVSAIVQKTCERCLVILSEGYVFPEPLDEQQTINSISNDPSTISTPSHPTTPSQQERKEG